MGISLPFAERRKNPRFKVENLAYVVNAANPGLITDISMEGLSWRYVVRKKRTRETSPTLDIVIDDLEFSLKNLPYTVVSDLEAEHEGPDGSLVVRRRSVQFGELTSRQRARLEEIICHGMRQVLLSRQLIN